MLPLGDWAEIIARYGLELRQVYGQLRGCCPLHGGDNPSSFVITPGKGFYCHACGAGGGPQRFVALMEGRASPPGGAMRAREKGRAAGLPSGVSRGEAAVPEGTDQQALPTVDPIGPLDPEHPYVAARGIAVATAGTFGCGFFAGPGALAGRIVFPVHDFDGRLVGHIGRAVADDGAPRYLASKGLAKGRLFFNEHRAKAENSQTVIVVEGLFDVLAVHQAGAPNVVALMGCRASGHQLERLARFRHVVVLFDDDDSGREGARYLASTLPQRVTVLPLPRMDPASLHPALLAGLVRGALAPV